MRPLTVDEDLAFDACRSVRKPGAKERCRFCGRVLTLRPWKVLDDGTQVYWWTGSRGERECNGRAGGIGAPEHRPVT